MYCFVSASTSLIGVSESSKLRFSDSVKPAEKPYFDDVGPRNVTAVVGQSTILNCRVKHPGERTVRSQHIVEMMLETYLGISHSDSDNELYPHIYSYPMYLFVLLARQQFLTTTSNAYAYHDTYYNIIYTTVST